MSKLLLFNGIYFLLYTISYAQQQPYKPLRIEEDILLDGKLMEVVWQQAEMESDFMQTDPNPGANSTDRTEVRIVYNNEYLYAGIRCFDSLPSKMTRLKLERDFSLGEDDGTGFIIDTYHDKISGINFVCNTLNARWDAQVSQDGNDLNDSYNTFWDAVTSIDSSGYTTEYRIPFSSLRFESKDTVIMAFRVARLVKRKNELTTFPKLDPSIQNGWTNISFAREMVFYNLKSRKPFYIIPYVIANYSEVNELNAAGTAYEKDSEFLTRKHFFDNEILDKIVSNIGVDAKYGLSKNLTLDLTINTDFAQAEVDDRIINLTKYDINLPEKRNFFLESANNLSFGFPSGNALFISRNIGNENDVSVPIIGGARLTGKVNGWQLGILNMQTTGVSADSIHAHNFSVFRTRKDIDSIGSFIGGIITNRINTDTTNASAQSFGIDFVKRINTQLLFEGGIAGTSEDMDLGQISKSLYLHTGIFKNTNTGFNFGSFIDLIGKEFNPVMGYLDENDYGLISGNIGYQFSAKEESAAQYWYINTKESYRWKLSSGDRETFNANLFPGVSLKNGAEIEFSIFEYKIDSLFEDFILDDDNAIAAGTYKMLSNTLNLTSPQKSAYFAEMSITYGGFYGGKRFSISPFMNYNINKHLSTGITYEYNHIAFEKYLDDPIQTVYESNLIRVNFSVLLSTKFSIKLFTQFDDVSDQLSSNLRIRYNPQEGTDLYIVLNQGLHSDRTRLDPHLPALNSQAVTIKFVNTFGE